MAAIFFIRDFFHFLYPYSVSQCNFTLEAGLEMAKQTLMEMVILPTKRKDLFTGLRKPAKGNIRKELTKQIAPQTTFLDQKYRD